MTTSTKPWSLAPLGMLTIGTGSSSQSSERSEGNFSPDAYIGPTNIGDTAATIRAALLKTKSLRLLAGLYPPFLSSVALPDGCEITAEPGAILQPCVTGAVGLFTGTGSARLSGFRVKATTFVNDQRLMRFTGGKDVKVEDVTWQLDTTAAGGNATLAALGYITNATPATVVGDEAHPMVCVEFIGTLRKRVRGNTFLPNYAWTCIKTNDGAGYDFDNNNFTNDVDAGLGGVQIAVPRLCYRCIDIDGDEWGGVFRNRFWGLGDGNIAGLGFNVGAPYLVDAAIRMNGNGAITVNETGHSQVALNRIENVMSKKSIRIQGYTSTTLMCNLIGYNGQVCSATGEAGIVITCEDADTTPITANVTYSANIVGCDVHNQAVNAADTETANPGAPGGSHIYLSFCDDVNIQSNRLGVCTEKYVIQIASASVSRPFIGNNKFVGEGATAWHPVGILGASNVVDGIVVGYNAVNGFDTAKAFVYDESNAGASGRRKILNGLQDTVTKNQLLPAYTSTGVTVTGANTFNDSNNGLGFLVAGDFVGVLNSTGAGNNAIHRVTVAAAGAITVASTLTNDASAGESVIFFKINQSPTTNVVMDA